MDKILHIADTEYLCRLVLITCLFVRISAPRALKCRSPFQDVYFSSEAQSILLILESGYLFP